LIVRRIFDKHKEKQMKKTAINLSVVAVVLMSSMTSVVLAEAFSSGSKKFTLRPGTSGYEKITMKEVFKVNVRARVNQGSVQIKVVDGKGRTVASGSNKVSFKSSAGKNGYKITVTNKTKKIQKVDLSWIIIQS